jgi:hypothetical protein
MELKIWRHSIHTSNNWQITFTNVGYIRSTLPCFTMKTLRIVTLST